MTTTRSIYSFSHALSSAVARIDTENLSLSINEIRHDVEKGADNVWRELLELTINMANIEKESDLEKVLSALHLGYILETRLPESTTSSAPTRPRPKSPPIILAESTLFITTPKSFVSPSFQVPNHPDRIPYPFLDSYFQMEDLAQKTQKKFEACKKAYTSQPLEGQTASALQEILSLWFVSITFSVFFHEIGAEIS